MNTLDLKVDTTCDDSPRGWQEYLLLHSPKAGLLSGSSKLTFIILFFGAGVLIGSTCSKIGSQMVPGRATFPTSKRVAYMDGTNDSYLRKKSTNETLPIAWLMSFPNSGTSYTIRLVRTTTGKNTATNYGTRNLGNDGTSVAVFRDSPGGPYWSDPLTTNYAQPKRGYLLTKTHCGGKKLFRG